LLLPPDCDDISVITRLSLSIPSAGVIVTSIDQRIAAVGPAIPRRWVDQGSHWQMHGFTDDDRFTGAKRG
jgi:hypothetical protein